MFVQLISHFELPYLLNTERLQYEIRTIVEKMSAKSYQFYQQQRHLWQSKSPTKDQTSESEKLLLQWCQAICSNYEIWIQNYSAAFADGRALCYLIHYYHPRVRHAI